MTIFASYPIVFTVFRQKITRVQGAGRRRSLVGISDSLTYIEGFVNFGGHFGRLLRLENIYGSENT